MGDYTKKLTTRSATPLQNNAATHKWRDEANTRYITGYLMQNPVGKHCCHQQPNDWQDEDHVGDFSTQPLVAAQLPCLCRTAVGLSNINVC